MQINRCKADFSRVNPSSERRDTPSDAAPLFPQKLSRFFICNLQWIRIPTMGGVTICPEASCDNGREKLRLDKLLG